MRRLVDVIADAAPVYRCYGFELAKRTVPGDDFACGCTQTAQTLLRVRGLRLAVCPRKRLSGAFRLGDPGL